MLKRYMILAAACLTLTAQAARKDSLVEDSLIHRESSVSETMLRPLEPTYMKNVRLASGSKANRSIGRG